MPLRYQFPILLACFLGVEFCLLFTDTGRVIDSYKGVPIYSNGVFEGQTHGHHYSPDNYYFGIKWQCVEFVRRFYKNVKKHEMPEKQGDAKDYFDASLDDGCLNLQRGLVQYRNGSLIKPAVDDLIVCLDGRYGHVAVITRVADDFLEVANQNIFGKTRHRLPLENRQGRYFVVAPMDVGGWLRLESGNP